ncbi:NUDIX domain-containing protein [Paenochrobactrum pullorum]|uniref:NUDIX domain-containing protein n=1 Tax=Paenochrobactrum pullorum TaxID=1324351 RepID=UPI0035BC114C
MIEKACPVVFRTSRHGLEVLAFIHPLAGKQFVKGTVEDAETARYAAEQELREESGWLFILR